VNRPLKFRVWDIRQGRYLLPHESLAYYYLYPTREESIAHEQGRGIGIVHLGWAIARTDRYVVEQFTGLKDYNSKEIYEGDIIRGFTNNGTSFEIGVCKQVLGGWIISNARDSTICWHGWEQEIIGNIHENPELLK